MSIAFIFHLFDDEVLAQRLIRQLRQFYPSADLLCVADGVNPPGFSDYAMINAVQYLQGDRLKPRSFGGQWTQRYLEIFLAHSSATQLLKLDPDSFVYRELLPLPHRLDADLCGNLKLNHLGQTQVRGGCIGYQREVCQQIVNSRLLLDDKYRDATRYSYRRQPDDPLLTLQDAIVADVAQRLQLQLYEYTDVSIRSGAEPSPPNPLLQFAVTHPVKR